MVKEDVLALHGSGHVTDPVKQVGRIDGTPVVIQNHATGAYRRVKRLSLGFLRYLMVRPEMRRDAHLNSHDVFSRLSDALFKSDVADAVALIQ